MLQPMEGNHQLYDSKKMPVPGRGWLWSFPRNTAGWTSHLVLMVFPRQKMRTFPAMLVYRRLIHPYFNIWYPKYPYFQPELPFARPIIFGINLLLPWKRTNVPWKSMVGRVTHPILRTFRTANWHRKIDSKLAKVPVHGTVTAAFPMAV